MHVLVIGSGIFGVTAALELRARDCQVTLADPGPIPHPLAESTDINKMVRCDYGDDEDYTVLGERSLDGWRRWNATWRTPRFHETGVAFVTRAPMAAGGFEHASFELLARRGHRVERLDPAAIATRFPAYAPGAFVDGYYHHDGGWAESGATVAQLALLAELAGVEVRPGCAIDRIVDDGALAGDEHLRADLIVVCAGAWTPLLVPELAGAMRATGQPIFHLQPADPSLFEARRFPAFGGDISRTGYYGFPLHGGVVKIANHGTGLAMAPTDPREVLAAQEAQLRGFLREAFPALADAPIVYRRLCVYGDSQDGHFWIARHPTRPNLTVAAGGSGHAFKFAPVLGELIADAALGRTNRFSAKFAWRADDGVVRGDAARGA